MARKALGIYLNDHLAAATMGRDLARQLASQTEGTPLGERMGSIAAAIEADREELETLSLGVEGKLALWQALAAIGEDEPALGPMDLQDLIRRAETQRVALERERLALAPEALSDEED
jgi:hypothetical protein